MRVAITNFTGGEVAPSLSARYDLSRYKNSVQCMENFLPTVHGNVERRPGTMFLADLGTGTENDAVLLPFSFNVEAQHNFVLIFAQNTLRIAHAEGLIPMAVLETPYDKDDLLDISFAQVGDIVYLAHQKYPLHKISRSGVEPWYAWTLSEVMLNASLPAPATPIVSFTGEANGYTLRYKIVAVDAQGKESLPSAVGSITGRHPSDWVVGNRSTISWSAVAEAAEYNIYREEAGYFGFIGISTNLSFVDNNYEADISDTPKEDWFPFADGNYPGIVSFHQQRMILASTRQNPQAFYMSRVGDFENFRKSRPLQEDDPVEYHIASGNIDAITWAASFGDLLIGTSGSEYKASGEGTAISAVNIQITAQSYWGSSNLFPIIIGNSIMHVQRHGARVRDLFYSLEKDGYSGNDLSIMAPHLFDGHSLKQWAYQQTPYSTIWIVRDDGVLLALTYMKEHDIWGWSRHETQGKVRSVVSVSAAEGDAIYMVVARMQGEQEHYYLEKLHPRWQESQGIEQAFFLDAGISFHEAASRTQFSGLEHLEDAQVIVLADGSPVENVQVRQGSLTLPYAAKTVHVGLAYRSALAPLPSEGEGSSGTSLGKMRALGQSLVRVQHSVGGKYGASLEHLYEFPFTPSTWGSAVSPFSGDMHFLPGGGQEPQSTVWIVQDSPLPFTVSALVLDVDMQN